MALASVSGVVERSSYQSGGTCDCVLGPFAVCGEVAASGGSWLMEWWLAFLGIPVTWKAFVWWLVMLVVGILLWKFKDEI